MRMIQAVPVSRLRKFSTLASTLAFTTLLSACGSSGGDAPAPDSGTNTDTTQTTSSGSVSGFGSVIVNGVRYDDTNVAVTLNNNANANADDLRLGMVVEVDGPVDDTGLTGTAESITARSFVQGPITAIDAAAAEDQLTVLGVTVDVNAGTIFEGAAGVAELAAGETVEIYGYGDEAGNLVATRIERNAEDQVSGEVRLIGNATAANASSFTINGVLVQYNAAAAINIDGGVVTDDARVVVSGTLADATATPLTIIATDVRELENSVADQEGQRVELEGVVTTFRSETDFDVNGRPVTVATGAELEGTVVQGSIIEVEGTVTNGVLVATIVEVKDPAKLAKADITGPANNINTSAQTFTMRGGRLTIQWDANTEFDDETLPNGASSLTSNQVIEVDGRIEGNVIVAESIEGVSNGGQGAAPSLEAGGRISNLDATAQTFTLRNGRLTVQWDGNTQFDSESLPNGASSLANNLEIEVEGRRQGSVLLATRIEGEDMEETTAEPPADTTEEPPADTTEEPPTDTTPTT
jgi:hypothetical protein